MYLVTVAIERTARTAEPALQAGVVTTAIRAAAAPEDGLEHVSARAEPGIVRIGLFCQARDRESAEECAHRICRKALEGQLLGWQIAGEVF